LIKETIPDQLLVEWFTKSLFPPIAHDVAMGGVITEEESIAHAQYLDLVYSQSGTLYELIPNAPHPSTDPSKPSSTAHTDGVIGSIKTQSSSQSTDMTNHSVTSPATRSTSLSSNSPPPPPPPTQISEVNAVQSASPQQSEGKKKTKNKPKKNNNQTKMKKHKHNHLLLRNNHSANQNFHVSFVVKITTHEIVLIETKLPNFLKEILNPLY
jgi:hypothetical protein